MTTTQTPASKTRSGETTSVAGQGGSPCPPSTDPGTLARIALLLASTLTVMAGATISPSLPALYDHFQGTEGVAFLSRLVLTLPALFITICAPLAGLVVDRMGRKPVIITGALLYCLGGTTGLYVDTLTGLLVGRAILGVAVACIMTTTITLIGDYWRGAQRGRMMGWMAAFMSWGGVVFVLLGGALAEVSWRGPFGVYMASLFLLPLLVLSLREPVHPAAASAAKQASGQGGSNGANGDTDGDADAVTPNWGMIAVSYAAAFMLNITFYMVPTQSPFLLRDLGIVAPFATGLIIAIMNGSGGVASLQFGRLQRLFSAPALFGASFACMAAGFFGVWQADGRTGFMLAMVLTGIGVGTAFPNCTAWLMTLAPPHLRGRLVGGSNMCTFLGQFLSPVLSQPLVHTFGQEGAFGLVAVVLTGLSLGFWGLVAWQYYQQPRTGASGPSQGDEPPI